MVKKKYYGKCELCGGNLVKDREVVVSGTTYFILKCEKCGHEVAKNKDDLKL